ncbi:hypothetical protein [Streptomyces sp. V3I7]|uniref:hypothetical protein n=1 Tax=Streptomyces sp. V3I7 TaxID=3042278 RepID=UPI00359432CC
MQQQAPSGQAGSGWRGDPLEEVLERFAESSGRARDFAGVLHGSLSKACAAVGHLAYNDVAEERTHS